MDFFNSLLNRRNNKFGEAIMNGDTKTIDKILRAGGVKNFKYTQMQPIDVGQGRKMVPAEVFNDPYRLAEKTLGSADSPRKTEVLRMLRLAGYGPKAAPTNPQVKL